MKDKINNLIDGDPLARSLINDAADSFQTTKADKDLLHRIKSDAKHLAEEFLNAYLAHDLENTTTEEIRKELDRIRVGRKIKNVSSELLEIYKCLGLIREYSSSSVELDYPQSMVDPLILRAYPTETIITVGIKQGFETQPLVELIERAYQSLNLSPEKLSPEIASRYKKLSYPLLLNYQDIVATKVYFMGPIFYGNAGKKWSLTFSTGSGLPDPLEWNGSLWFYRRYGVTLEQLKEKGIGDKNPFRALNFSLGICNPQWKCKRLYVWQYSKTSLQVQKAYSVACEVDLGDLYIKDAVKQLIQVFTTPNLKILNIDRFPESLRAWTRVSPEDIMLSCRPDTPESRIAHGLWVRPGLRLSEAAIKGLQSAVAGVLAAGALKIPEIGPILAALAVGGSVFFLEKALKHSGLKHGRVMKELQQDVERALDDIWNYRDMSCIVKQPESYQRERAFETACRTLSWLLGTVTYEEVLSKYKSEPNG